MVMIVEQNFPLQPKIWVNGLTSSLVGGRVAIQLAESYSRSHDTDQMLSKKSTYRALLDSVTTGEDSARFQIINEPAKVRKNIFYREFFVSIFIWVEWSEFLQSLVKLCLLQK